MKVRVYRQSDRDGLIHLTFANIAENASRVLDGAWWSVAVSSIEGVCLGRGDGLGRLAWGARHQRGRGSGGNLTGEKSSITAYSVTFHSNEFEGRR